jgi:YesN/AraC family two-component response regulator
MIRIMIVEDDVLFRKTIRSMLDWESLGFTICGECIHGKDALKHMAKYAPDVVLTDISMPQMNGIELIREIKKDYPLVHIIVLSAYHDFDLVKEAMKLGADDYILKHDINNQMNKFLQVLEELKGKITLPAAEGASGGESEKQLMLDAFMSRVLDGRITGKAEIENRLRRLMVYFPFDRYIMAVVLARKAFAIVEVEKGEHAQWHPNSSEANEFHRIILDIARPTSLQCMAFMPNDRTGVCLFNVKGIFSQSRMQNMVRSKLIAMFASGLDLSIGVGPLAENVSGLQASYRQACNAAEDGFLYAARSIIFDRGANTRQLPEEIHPLFDKLQEILDNEKYVSANAWAAQLTNAIYSKQLPVSSLYEVCDHLNHGLELWAKKHNVTMERLTGYGKLPVNLLVKAASKEVFTAYLQKCLNNASTFNEMALKTANPHIKQAVDYINANYQHPIGLPEASRALGISENYLSNLFKQETGRRFIEYLNDVRLHHAKWLVLNGNMKVYEIAHACGFQSTAYFCRLFKIKNGMSLKEYLLQNGFCPF